MSTVPQMQNDSQNISNALFEHYLQSQRLSWDYEPEAPDKVKKPDYRIAVGGEELRLEIKEFELDYVLHFGEGFEKSGGAYNPLPRIREKINQARKQFREYKDSCCALVLYNPGFPRVDIHEPLTVFGAMLGNPGIRYSVDRTKGRVIPPIRQAFLGGGRMRAGVNTTVSAVFVFEEFFQGSKRWRADEQRQWKAADPEERTVDIAADDPESGNVVRLVRYQNPFARKPFPRKIFCGPADEVWQVDESGTRPIQKFAGPFADRLWSRRLRTGSKGLS